MNSTARSDSQGRHNTMQSTRVHNTPLRIPFRDNGQPYQKLVLQCTLMRCKQTGKAAFGTGNGNKNATRKEHYDRTLFFLTSLFITVITKLEVIFDIITRYIGNNPCVNVRQDLEFFKITNKARPDMTASPTNMCIEETTASSSPRCSPRRDPWNAGQLQRHLRQAENH